MTSPNDPRPLSSALRGGPRGRYTPPGTRPAPRPRMRGRPSERCGCAACAAERAGIPFDWEAEREHYRSLIERAGIVIQYVTGSRRQAPWAYTIGRVRQGLPELLVTGLAPDAAGALLNALHAHWHTLAIADDGRCTLQGDRSFPLALVPVPDHLWDGDYLLGAQRDAVEQGNAHRRLALQVLWPDDAGRFPWDPTYALARGRSQPIVGLQASAGPGDG